MPRVLSDSIRVYGSSITRKTPYHLGDGKPSDIHLPDKHLEASALVIANLYKNRWSVELFFVKQHLKIKKFWVGIRKRCPHSIYCAFDYHYRLVWQ